MIKIKTGKFMKIFYLTFFIVYCISFESFASKELSEFKKVRNNNYTVTKVFESNEYYFSQVSYDWNKKSNRKNLSRKGTIEAIKILKNHVLRLNKIPDMDKLSKWGASLYLKNNLKIQKSRKIEDRRFKKKYLVVFSIPKKSINLDVNNINLEKLLSFNARNHLKFSKTERDKFLSQLNFKDIILLWNIFELEKKYNLTNVLDMVHPTKYQKKIIEIINVKKPNLSLLNEAPAFSYIIDNYLKFNKPSNNYDYLAVLSSKCNNDNEFRNKLMDIKIDSLNFNSSNSVIFDTLAKCNGFLRFEKTLNQIDNNELNNIKKKFSKGEDLEGIILLTEKTLSKSPFNFQLWNYYSACLRAKNKFKEALIVSRVEISIALQLNNDKMYTEALKSYSKSKIKIQKNFTKEQKQFLKSII